MRRVDDVIEEYDATNDTDRKKIILIEWFQKHPGERFDKIEVYNEVHDEVEVGQGRVGQYLNELEDDSVLESHGSQRKAYQLEDDILVPIKYRVLAGLRHLSALFDTERWGKTGFVMIATILWAFLTLPFWFLSLLLIISPADHIGPISGIEASLMAIAMTIWLVIFIIISYILYSLRWWWQKRSTVKEAEKS